MRVRLLRDKKGVSPVIGVILMVAITVILAAVIASFVFGMGSKVKSAPQAQFMLEDASNALTETNNHEKVLLATLYGGEDLRCNDIRIQVVDTTNDQTYTLTWSGNDVFNGSNINATLNDANDDDMINVGETLTVWENGTNINSGVTIEFRVIHIPTGTVIYDGRVLVN